MASKHAFPVSNLRVGEPKSYRDFLLYPLFLDKHLTRPPFYTLRSPEIRKKLIVSELANSTVGKIQVENLSDHPILLPSGQSLIGAKQNRTSNTDYLIAPHSKAVIDVSCTERGRWHYKGENRFTPGEDLDPFPLKVSKLSRYASPGPINRDDWGRRRSPHGLQSSIWNEIHNVMIETESHSPTGALSDWQKQMKKQERSRIEQIPRTSEGQEGVLVSWDSKVIGMEFYCGYENYYPYHEAVVRSLTFLPARLRAKLEKAPSLSAKEWLQSMEDMPISVQAAVNLGQNVRLGDEHTKLDMLTYQDVPLHISAIRI